MVRRGAAPKTGGGNGFDSRVAIGGGGVRAAAAGKAGKQQTTESPRVVQATPATPPSAPSGIPSGLPGISQVHLRVNAGIFCLGANASHETSTESTR